MVYKYQERSKGHKTDTDGAIFHLDWPAKKDPHKSGSTCLKCRVLKGKAGLVGVFFSQANPSGTLAF